MQLWRNETHEHYNARRGEPGFLRPEHKARWERLRQARMLFEGKHRRYYLEEGRTQFDYPEADINGKVFKPYHTYNLLRLVSVKTADLLFGAKVRLTAPGQRQTAELDALVRRSMLHSRLHSAVVAASWSGGSFLEAIIWQDEPYIVAPSPDEVYPLGPVLPNGQYERYLRYATANVGTKEQPLMLVLESEYQPGRIIRRLFEADLHGDKKREVKLSEWPEFRTNAPPPEELLGIPDNPITYLPNEVGGVAEVSDYDGLIGQQDNTNAKIAQLARIIAMHADPKLAMPEADAGEGGAVPARHNLYFFRSKEEAPFYIVWQAQIEGAQADLRNAINALCTASEMSQVLLGIKEGAAPDAARKLRLEATNTLAKVGRKALLIEPAIARALDVAQRLDQTTRLKRSYPVGPIGVEPRDGLPVDEIDEANLINALTGGKQTMSVEAAVERRIEDPDAVAQELRRLEAERLAATPTVLLGEPGETAPARTDDDTNELATAATAEAA